MLRKEVYWCQGDGPVGQNEDLSLDSQNSLKKLGVLAVACNFRDGEDYGD